MEEEDYVIAQVNASIDSEGRFIDNLISCRQDGEFILTTKDNIDLILTADLIHKIRSMNEGNDEIVHSRDLKIH